MVDDQYTFSPEKWYSQLADQTFRTEFVPVKREEALALVQNYQQQYREQKDIGAINDDQTTILLHELSSRIDECLKQHFAKTNAFVRLSTRSPKDGIPRDLAAWQKAFEEALSAKVSALRDNDANEIAKQFYKVSMQALLVKSGDDAMALLKSSERVQVDLVKALGQEQQPDLAWSMNIVLREWDAKLDQEHEFRCFISRGQLTAISQYNHYCYYEHIAREAKILEQRLQEYIESIKSRISHLNYVLDLGIREDGQVIVIELNPFSSPGSLFNWKTDRAQLIDGPLEFRYLTEPNEDLSIDFISINVDQVFGVDYFDQLKAKLLAVPPPLNRSWWQWLWSYFS